jgi:glycosyltransferase involved in cell wall biosynthesis
MKNYNILILTSEYPNPSTVYDTPVVHFFAKEWVKMGHSVKVIHYRSVFPSFFYVIARMFKSVIKRVFKTDFIPFEKLQKANNHHYDGVDIIMEPIFKYLPHIKFSRYIIKKKALQIITLNQKMDWKPDLFIGHFLNPQLQLFSELRSIYPNSKFSLVLHENPAEIKRLFGANAIMYLNNIDFIGFRYLQMKNIFESFYGSKYSTFLCPSGVPESYVLNDVPFEKFKSESLSIAFVGMLIPLKNIDIVLKSLALSFPNKNFSFKLIGDGMLRAEIESQIIENDIQEQVRMLGKKSRDEVQEELVNTDVFVMVSKPEAFGLVYLEAMGKGCITIGTIGQGIDGVIQNGENGFLCEAGNVDSLKKVFIKIAEMTYEEKLIMSQKALITARHLTDEKVANSYLQKLNLV